MQNTQNIIEEKIQYNMKYKISLDSCKIIESRIKQENQEKGKHMLEKSAEELFDEANNNGCVIIEINSQIVGFITMINLSMDGTSIFERWSLFVKKEYRKMGIGYLLVKEMLEKYGKDHAMYCVTNVEAAKKINQNLWQHKYKKTDIPLQILKIIEIPWKLLKNDELYCNQILDTLIKTNQL